MYHFVIEDDQGQSRQIPFEGDELTIGRKAGLGLCLDEQNISRVHARLRGREGRLFLDDLSRYGTRVNGAKVQGNLEIQPGDHIQIGDFRVVVHSSEHRKEEGGSGIAPKARAVTPAAGTPAVPGIPHQVVGGRKPGAGGAAVSPVSGSSPSSGGGQQPIFAHLVVIGSETARRRFLLNRDELIIGRTDDNDIVIDHQSISRHHARLLYNGRRYSVVDLNSANGVKVNGEDCGARDLSNGDVIELGSIKLRFVKPDEKAPYEEAIEAFREQSKRNRTLGVVLLLFLLVGVGGLVGVSLMGPFADWLGGVDPLAGTTPSPQQDIAGERVDLEAVLDLLAKETDLETVLGYGQQLISVREWAGAEVAFVRALELEPSHEEGTRQLDKTRTEMQNAETFQQLKQAVAEGDVEAMDGHLSSIPSNSEYRNDGDELVQDFKGQQAKAFLQAAQAAYDAGDDERTLELVDRCLKFQKDNRSALNLRMMARTRKIRSADGAKKVVARGPAPSPGPKSSAKSVPSPTASDSAAASSSPPSAPQKAVAGEGKAKDDGKKEPAPAPPDQQARAASEKPKMAPPEVSAPPPPSVVKEPSPPAPGDKQADDAQQGQATAAASPEAPVAPSSAQRGNRERALEQYRAGRRHLMEGNQAAAAADFASAASSDPRWGEPHWQLGSLYIRQGKNEEACHHLARFLALNPDSSKSPAAQNARDKLSCP